MARMHGKDVRVYFRYLDVSAHIGAIDFAVAAETRDRTTFANAGWRAFDGGLVGCEGSFDGFYDNNPLINQDFSASNELLLGTNPVDLGGGFFGNSGVLSVYDGAAAAVGDRGFLFPPLLLTRLGRPVQVGDLITERVAFKGVGRMGLGAVLLHPLGTETATGNGTSVDNGASSANGGRATLHAPTTSGTWTRKVQHSTDNASWFDLVTFPQDAASGGVWTIEVSGAVNRYLRMIWTEDVAGSATFVGGFARH